MDRQEAINAALDRIHAQAAIARATARPRKVKKSPLYGEMSDAELYKILARVEYAQPFADRKDHMTARDHQEVWDYQIKSKVKREIARREDV